MPYWTVDMSKIRPYGSFGAVLHCMVLGSHRWAVSRGWAVRPNWREEPPAIMSWYPELVYISTLDRAIPDLRHVFSYI